MISAIVTALKYSALVLTVLVLSHIIQIKGTTISRHVENGMSWVSGGRSYSNISSVTQHFSSAVHHDNKEDADGISNEDKKELDSVIKRSSRRR
jgi:hypothetical protein